MKIFTKLDKIVSALDQQNTNPAFRIRKQKSTRRRHGPVELAKNTTAATIKISWIAVKYLGENIIMDSGNQAPD